MRRLTKKQKQFIEKFVIEHEDKLGMFSKLPFSALKQLEAMHDYETFDSDANRYAIDFLMKRV